MITLILVLLLGFMSSCAGDEEKKQVGELRRIESQTPVFPGFQRADEKVVIKPGAVWLFCFYDASAKFADVKKFYDDALPEKGWGPPMQPPPSIFGGETNWVSYKRGDYQVIIEKDESRDDRFHLVFKWLPD